MKHQNHLSSRKSEAVSLANPIVFRSIQMCPPKIRGKFNIVYKTEYYLYSCNLNFFSRPKAKKRILFSCENKHMSVAFICPLALCCLKLTTLSTSKSKRVTTSTLFDLFTHPTKTCFPLVSKTTFVHSLEPLAVVSTTYWRRYVATLRCGCESIDYSPQWHLRPRGIAAASVQCRPRWIVIVRAMLGPRQQ